MDNRGMRMVTKAAIGSLVALGAASAGCGDDEGADAARTLTVAFRDAPATAAGRTALGSVALAATWSDGDAAANITFDLEAAGGGSVEPARVTTDASGVARFAWTLGALPIDNHLVADAGDLGDGELTVVVDPAAALQSAVFGDVDAFIAARGEGSTEDLALAPDGTFVMAHGGAGAGLFTVTPDGEVAALATTGEAFVNPLGLAFDQNGALFVADGGAKAVLKVAVGGAVTKLAERDGVESFLSPNDVAVGPDGVVYVSDTCTGKVYALDPASGEVRARIAFDPATEGGPNGLVVGPDGALWMTTENTAIFCGHDSVALTAPVAGLFRIPLGGAAVFGAKETLASAVGVFGDGLAFDAHGNLYVIFDTVEGLALKASIVYVRRASGGPLVPAFAGTGKVYANLAFGGDAFGATTMYLAMLKIALVPGSPRGLERVDVGVAGATLPPR